MVIWTFQSAKTQHCVWSYSNTRFITGETDLDPSLRKSAILVVALRPAPAETLPLQMSMQDV
jgi:hypothetical protein